MVERRRLRIQGSAGGGRGQCCVPYYKPHSTNAAPPSTTKTYLEIHLVSPFELPIQHDPTIIHLLYLGLDQHMFLTRRENTLLLQLLVYLLLPAGHNTCTETRDRPVRELSRIDEENSIVRWKLVLFDELFGQAVACAACCEDTS